MPSLKPPGVSRNFSIHLILSISIQSDTEKTRRSKGWWMWDECATSPISIIRIIRWEHA
jgi:hypothetical protein